jgi:hypothetical protein
MGRFTRDEVEQAFAHLWKAGCVDEDWAAWTACFTPDVVYYDSFWGWLVGRDEVLLWIDAVMKGVPEVYTVLEWHRIDDDIVTFHCQNRRDNPAPDGPPYFDFPSLSFVRYAGGGQFSTEEDFWELRGARDTSVEYAAACARAGCTTPEQRLSRRHWPASPAWARSDDPPKPSWLARYDVPGVIKPRELYALLGRERFSQPPRANGGSAAE